MKKLTFIFALLIAVSAFAEFKDLPAEAQKNLSAIKKYPKASSIILWTREVHTLNADGSQLYENNTIRYLPDEAARDNFGDPHLPFIAGRDSMQILTARCYTQDGRKTDSTPINAYNPIVPDGLDKSPDYCDFRNMVVTLMGLENGCITELSYRITTAKPQLPWLEGRVYLREEGPVMARELVINLPQGQSLNYKVDRGAAEPTVNGSSYSWTVGEQTGYDKLDLSGHRILLPNIAFTTAKDWNEVQSVLKTRLEQALSGDPLIVSSLQEALAGVSGDENRLDVIKNWVKERFNALEFEHPDFALRLRPAKQILLSGYGNSLEMAALVTKLADGAGIPLQVLPCFVPEPVVPSLHEWNRALIAPKSARSGLIWSDPIAPLSEFSTADLNGCWTLSLSETPALPEPVASPVKAPRFAVSIALENVDADTISGKGTLSVAGNWGTYEAVRSDGAEEFLNSKLHVKGLKITKAMVRELEAKRVDINFEFTAAALEAVDDYRVLSLAMLDFDMLTKDAPLALTKREFPQEVSMPGEITLRVEAAYPDKWEITKRLAGGSQTWDWSEGTINSTDQADIADGKASNHRVIVTRTLKLAREWIAADGYVGYRQWLIASKENPSNTVVFGPKAEKAGKK
jgi:hypothetical protein